MNDLATDAAPVGAWRPAALEGNIAVNAAGEVVHHDAAASRVTGLAPAAALGQPWRRVFRIDAEVAGRLASAIRTDAEVRLTAPIMCTQGNLRQTDIIARHWTDATGSRGFSLELRDIAVLAAERMAVGGLPGYGNLVGAHQTMRALRDLIEAVAPSDAPLVVEGEPGTGKELVAQMVHARSGRAERPLVVVDCAAVDGEALEAELFGEARSGESGLTHSVVGRVELAHSGTIVLDQVGASSPAVQAALLRFLQSGEITRQGDRHTRRADVRVIATTTNSLADDVRDGRLREDLYYRLKVVRLIVPPLRARITDLPHLVTAILARVGRADVTLTPPAMVALQAHEWPGNVRELERALRHAVTLLAPGHAVIGPEVLTAMLRTPPAARVARSEPSVAEDRRTVLLRALSSHGGNRTAAARALGIGRATFYRWWNAAGLGNDGTDDAPSA